MNYVTLFKPFLYNIYNGIERCMPKEFIQYRRAAARAGKTLGEFVYEPGVPFCSLKINL